MNGLPAMFLEMTPIELIFVSKFLLGEIFSTISELRQLLLGTATSPNKNPARYC